MEALMDTLWKNFSLAERYSISNDGRVFENHSDCPVTQTLNDDGYAKVTLRVGPSTRRTYSVHRLVALTFIENPEGKPTVNHIDGNKINNRVENLEWATRSEQTQHAWDTGLIVDMDSRRNGIRTHQGKKVVCITTGEEYESLGAAAEAHSIKKSNLSALCRGRVGYKTCGKLPDGTPLEWRFK
jgi:hypothetical protein